MKRTILTTLLLSAASAAYSAETPASTGLYLQAGPVVGLLGDFDTAVGPSLGIGYKINATHAVEVEASFLASESDWGRDVDFIPVLAKYRLSFPFSPKWTGSVAVAAGILHEEADSGWYYSGAKEVAFVGGVEAAIDYAVTDSIAVGAGVTSLYVSETDIATDGTIGLVNFRLSFRF